MSRLARGLLIGAVAGVLDVLPMIFLAPSRSAMASAFLHWVLLGFVITYIELPLRHWMKGLVVGLAAAVPVIAMVMEQDPKSVAPIALFSAMLGAAVGAATGRWASGSSA
ncbi:MAG: hypothetical protein QM784_23020 [Polyangiaceae bacterium]